MNPYVYQNGAGQRFPAWEQALEPPDCWGEEIDKEGKDDSV